MPGAGRPGALSPRTLHSHPRLHVRNLGAWLHTPLPLQRELQQQLQPCEQRTGTAGAGTEADRDQPGSPWLRVTAAGPPDGRAYYYRPDAREQSLEEPPECRAEAPWPGVQGEADDAKFREHVRAAAAAGSGSRGRAAAGGAAAGGAGLGQAAQPGLSVDALHQRRPRLLPASTSSGRPNAGGASGGREERNSVAPTWSSRSATRRC